MGTALTRISEKARKEPELVFTSLYHHISDVDNLRACYDSLDARKAPGADGVTKAEYGKNLEENLRNLSARLKRMGYRIGDERVIRLIIRMLKSGMMEDGLIHATEEGTAQGSILTPQTMLQNVR